MDSKIATGRGIERPRDDKDDIPENGIIQEENSYDPMLDGKNVWVQLEKLVDV